MTSPLRDQDPALRGRLRAALDADAPAETDALEERVLEQWRQRHAATGTVLASAGGAVLHAPGRGRRPLWLVSGALLLVALLITGVTWQRHDPAMDELMQLDVLSEMALGEM
jgi:hypothetical protein